jgi:hypothetical protein
MLSALFADIFEGRLAFLGYWAVLAVVFAAGGLMLGHAARIGQRESMTAS